MASPQQNGLENRLRKRKVSLSRQLYTHWLILLRLVTLRISWVSSAEELGTPQNVCPEYHHHIFVSYPGHSLGESAEKESLYSTSLLVSRLGCTKLITWKSIFYHNRLGGNIQETVWAHVFMFYYYLILEGFLHQLTLMVFHWNLSDSKYPQVSRTLLSILADLNNAVVWMVTTRPLISKSFSPLINSSVTVPKASITIGINVTFMFPSFFNNLAKSRYLSFFSLSFNFCQWSEGTTKSSVLQVLFFLLIIIRSGCLAKIWWSVCISKSKRSLCILFTRIDAGLCTYHLFVWIHFNFLQIPSGSLCLHFFFQLIIGLFI